MPKSNSDPKHRGSSGRTPNDTELRVPILVQTNETNIKEGATAQISSMLEFMSYITKKRGKRKKTKVPRNEGKS